MAFCRVLKLASQAFCKHKQILVRNRFVFFLFENLSSLVYAALFGLPINLWFNLIKYLDLNSYVHVY